MQIKILDYDFYQSASYLRIPQELNSQIYEAIHCLASLLDCVNDLHISDKCKAKIKNYKNYPQAKLWIGYEYDLLAYIANHIQVWFDHDYESYTNETNYWILQNKINKHPLLKQLVPKWITDEVIQIHRSVLIQKEIERENKFVDNYLNKYTELYLGWQNQFLHYRNLWPNCPRDLKMRYDFRENL